MGRNNEGYPDPTAAAAIGEVAKAGEIRQEQTAHAYLVSILRE